MIWAALSAALQAVTLQTISQPLSCEALRSQREKHPRKHQDWGQKWDAGSSDTWSSQDRNPEPVGHVDSTFPPQPAAYAMSGTGSCTWATSATRKWAVPIGSAAGSSTTPRTSASGPYPCSTSSATSCCCSSISAAWPTVSASPALVGERSPAGPVSAPCLGLLQDPGLLTP